MPIRQVELVVRRPGHPERRLILGVGTIHLGRGEENEIVLPDIGVSRRHAQIRVDASGVVVQDLSSGNGTFVGGQRISSHTVRDGDEVFIDPFVLAFHVKAEAVLPPTLATPESPSGAPTLHFSERDAPVQARLVVLQGQRLNASYQLTGPRLTMGRAEDHDVVLFDPAASRQHAEIRANGNDFWVVDPGSANGTFVNGHRIRETRLKHGDRIRVGATEFRFELLQSVVSHEAAPERAPGPPPAAVRAEPVPEVTGRTEPKKPDTPFDAPPAPAILSPRQTPPPAPIVPPIERASPPTPRIEQPSQPTPPLERASPLPLIPPPVPTLDTPPTAKPFVPPHDAPPRARMGDTIIPDIPDDPLPEPVSDPVPWTLGPQSAAAPHTEAFDEPSYEPTPPSPLSSDLAAVFSMAPPAAAAAPTLPVPQPPSPPSAPSIVPAASVSLDGPRRTPLKPTTPPIYPGETDPTERAAAPKKAVPPPPPVPRAMPSPPPAPRPSSLPTVPPARSRSAVGTFAAILAAMVVVGFLATAALIGLAVAYRSGVFDAAAPTAAAPAATHTSALSTLGMELMTTPALSADAARAFYHAALLDPADPSNARLAAVACESAAIAELRYGIERRALGDEEKKQARDAALSAAGDRQAALERAARLFPSDVDVRSALDAARQARLDEIRKALQADSGEPKVPGG